MFGQKKNFSSEQYRVNLSNGHLAFVTPKKTLEIPIENIHWITNNKKRINIVVAQGKDYRIKTPSADLAQSMVQQAFELIGNYAQSLVKDALEGKRQIQILVNLKKNESAVFQTPAVIVKEHRKRRTTYVGGSIRITKRIRVGSAIPITSEYLETVIDDSGNLVLTTERFIFLGDRKTYSIKLERILAYDLTYSKLVLKVEGRQSNLIFQQVPGTLIVFLLAVLEQSG